MRIVPRRTPLASTLRVCAIAAIWILTLAPGIHAVGEDTANKVLEGTADFLAQRIQDTTVDWFLTEVAEKICKPAKEANSQLVSSKRGDKNRVRLANFALLGKRDYFPQFCANADFNETTSVRSYPALAAALRADLESLPIRFLVRKASDDGKLSAWAASMLTVWKKVLIDTPEDRDFAAKLKREIPAAVNASKDDIKKECKAANQDVNDEFKPPCALLALEAFLNIGIAQKFEVAQYQSLCSALRPGDAACGQLTSENIGGIAKNVSDLRESVADLQTILVFQAEKHPGRLTGDVVEGLSRVVRRTAELGTTVCQQNKANTNCPKLNEDSLKIVTASLSTLAEQLAKPDVEDLQKLLYAKVPEYALMVIDLVQDLRGGNTDPVSAFAHLKYADPERWERLTKECTTSRTEKHLKPACWIQQTVEAIDDVPAVGAAPSYVALELQLICASAVRLKAVPTVEDCKSQTVGWDAFLQKRKGRYIAFLREKDRLDKAYKALQTAQNAPVKDLGRQTDAVFNLLGSAITTFQSGCYLIVIENNIDPCKADEQEKENLARLKAVFQMVAAFNGGKGDDGMRMLLDFMADHEAENPQLKEIRPYLVFVSEIAAAKTPAEVKTALDTVAAPVGAWRLKRQTGTVMSIGALGGGFGGWETARGVKHEEGATVYGPFAPIGFDVSFKIPSSHSTLGFFASIVNLGSAVSERVRDSDDKDSSVDSKSKVTSAQVYAPGFFIRVGMGNSPLVFGFGQEYAPKGRIVVENGKTREVEARRMLAFFAIDVVILPIGHPPVP